MRLLRTGEVEGICQCYRKSCRSLQSQYEIILMFRMLINEYSMVSGIHKKLDNKCGTNLFSIPN